MPSRVFVAGMIMVVSVSLLMFFIELFVPLSAKYSMDIYCRGALLGMEEAGGLTVEDRASLESGLTGAGFEDIRISGTDNAMQGGMLKLSVEAGYRYSKLKGLLTRSTVVQYMCYDKTAISRKVVN